ncbi:MAG: response regulator transcription factor [Bacteroidales bacterium]|nr:response regulator transcription factor [Bacteroidales bacterium]
MKILIIEDEQLSARKLIRLLHEINPAIEVLEVLASVEAAVNWMTSEINPDLLFMDIQLEDGLCFEIFEKTNINIPVIFTTAYDEYTLKAFKVNSIDYLLKPLKIAELKDALKKFRTLKNPMDFRDLNQVLEKLQPKQKERFLIKMGERYKSVVISEIECFYIKERSGFMHLSNGKDYAIDFSLDKIEEMVDSKMFFRINRNMIINFNSINEILAYSSSRLKITLKTWSEPEEILLSRERVNDFKNWMDR